MKFIFFFFFICSTAIFSQEILLKINADKFIGVDNLNNIFYVKKNVLYKKGTLKINNYANISLGNITLVDISNPLKIMVFYKDFNTLIILDKELNELATPIDFTTILFKNISYVGTSINTSLWLYSKDDNNLSLYNYKTNQVVFNKQLDVNFDYLNAISNYHNIWLVGKSTVLKYNAYGSFINKDTLINTTVILPYKNKIFYNYKNKLYCKLEGKLVEKTPLKTDLNTKDFFINNNKIYFFDGNIIYSQEIIKN